MKKIIFLMTLMAHGLLLLGQEDFEMPFAYIRYPITEFGPNPKILEFWKPNESKPVKILDLKAYNPFGKFKEEVVGEWDEFETPKYRLTEPKSKIDSINLLSNEFHLNTDDLQPFELLSSYTTSDFVWQNKSVAVLYELTTLNRGGANISTSSIIFVFDSVGNLISQTPVMGVACGTPATTSEGRYIFFNVTPPYGWQLGGEYSVSQFRVYDTKEKRIVYKSEKELFDNGTVIPRNLFYANDSHTFRKEKKYKFHIYNMYTMEKYTAIFEYGKNERMIGFENNAFVFWDRNLKKRTRKYYTTDFTKTDIQKL